MNKRKSMKLVVGIVKYVRKPHRLVLTYFKKHMAYLRYSRKEKLSVVQHAIDNNHKSNQLIKTV